MSDTIIVAIISVLSGGAFVALINAYTNRRNRAADARKTSAETNAIESSTRQSEVAYYREQSEALIKQMRQLEDRVAELKQDINILQTKYEQRVGQLHGKIDNLSSALDRANRNLDIANETIGQLRQEVKVGNVTITELREKITKLLVDRAEKKGD